MTVWTEAFYSLFHYFYPEYLVHLAATFLLTLLYWVGEGLHKFPLALIALGCY